MDTFTEDTIVVFLAPLHENTNDLLPTDFLFLFMFGMFVTLLLCAAIPSRSHAPYTVDVEPLSTHDCAKMANRV